MVHQGRGRDPNGVWGLVSRAMSGASSWFLEGKDYAQMFSLGRILVLRGRLQSLGDLEDGHGRQDTRDRQRSRLAVGGVAAVPSAPAATHLGHLPGPFLGGS